ncbi:MAG: hypothetical protein U9N72_12730 [Bacteroidota bacterium]|nr:hypothetical protein [Bacteroidota bacterium]
MKPLSIVLMLLLVFYSIHVRGQKETSPIVNSWSQYYSNYERSEFAGLKWDLIGPVINSGRVESIAVNPDKPSTIYAGYGSGNLWKTINHGFSWQPVFDNQPAYSIGDVCLAPSDPEIVYLATGENLRARRGHTFSGAGVYRSQDGGNTWQSLGLENTYHIGRVAVHPENPDIIFVAALGHFYSPNTERGLYKSSDGGKKWKKVLYIDDRTGANDVIFAPGNPDILYATTWQCSETIGGPGSSVYKSTNGGDSWFEVSNGLPHGEMNGRSGLAVSYQNPDLVYALTDNLNREFDEGTAELYMTVNGGESWSKTHEEGLKIFSTFGHVFADCYVNPINDNEVYLLGISILKSSDAGKTFKQLRGDIHNIVPSPANFFHVDHHDMWINPENPDHIIVGNDGGLYISYDKSASWFRYNNIPVEEFYFISTDNDNPYRIYGGTQDDAAVMGPAIPLKENTDKWKYVWIDPWTGGDGIVTEPDPEDSNTVYFESQNGAIRRKNMSTGETVVIKPELPDSINDEFFTEWLTPFFVSKYNHATLYYGANYLFKSINRGNTWKVISPNLANPDDKKRRGGGITALEESPVCHGLIYAGTAVGAAWVSKDDGITWKDISEGLPVKYIKSFAPSRFNKSRVYVTLSGIKHDDFAPMVFMSDDYGKTWHNISSDIPVSPVNVIIEDPENEDVLYTGTFDGVMVSVNRGNSWKVLGKGIPHSFVADMTIMEREADLIAATHGRGIFKIDLEPLYEYLSTNSDSARILYITEAKLPEMDASGKKPDLTTHYDVHFSFFIPRKGILDINIIDSEDHIVFNKKQEFRKGLNTWSWDMITGINKNEEDSPYFYKLLEFAEPGSYMIKINGKSIDMKKKFHIK